MAKQRISYVPLEKMDAKMRAEMERCQREGTPRPESSADPRPCAGGVLVLRQFLEQPLPQRRARSRHQGAVPALRLALGAVRVLRQPALGEVDDQRRADRRACAWTFSTSRNPPSYNERQKAALAYAEAITWHLNTDDAFWDRMHKNFSEPELVELGCMIGLTLGQQSWLRLLNIEHHQVMAGTDASMAPGYESMDKLKMTKAQADYWAKQKADEAGKVA